MIGHNEKHRKDQIDRLNKKMKIGPYMYLVQPYMTP